MVLNDDAVHSDQTGRGKLESASINFLAGSRKTVPLACRSEDWIKIPTQSSRRLQELTYLRVFLSILLDESQRLHFPPPALS